MPGNTRRVAVLARPGVASDRLRDMLIEAGVERVLHADPTQLDTPELMAAEPDVVVIALDADTEEVLGRFDAVLGDPAIDVIYEEADLTVTREGWDAARWKRHLIAKLQGHGDVLPPGTEPPTPTSDEVAPVSLDRHSAFDPVMAEFDYAGVDIEFDPGIFDPGHSDPGNGARTGTPPVDMIEFDDSFDDAGGEALTEFSDAQQAGGQDDGGDDPAEAGVGTPDRFFQDSPLSLADEVESAPAPDTGIHSGLQRDLADLEQRISTLELVDDTPLRGLEPARGAVLVMAGIGGPDAVRQLLGALPADFQRPVLVLQRLDGGRYDKLVAQMQRATPLSVRLAESGQIALAGHIYIMPAELRVSAGIDGLRFNSDGDEILTVLPAADSAILLLSGSDPADVDAVMNHGWAGALIAGQAPDGCYDPAAPAELAARGGDTAAPAELAQRLIQRWPA